MELQELAENSFTGEQTEPEAVPFAVRNATAVTYKSDGETFSLRHDYAIRCIRSILCESFALVFNSQSKRLMLYTTLWEGVRFPALEKNVIIYVAPLYVYLSLGRRTELRPITQ